jgi:hypothetical protein
VTQPQKSVEELQDERAAVEAEIADLEAGNFPFSSWTASGVIASKRRKVARIDAQVAAIPGGQREPTSADIRAELGDLDADVTGLKAQVESFGKEIDALALESVRGNGAAAAKIDSLRKQMRETAGEVETIHAARHHLDAELAGAVERESAEARAENARQAQSFSDQIGPRGVVMDQHLAEFVALYAALRSDLGAASVAGYGPPPGVVINAMERALSAAIMRLGIHELRTIGPTQRHTFEELTQTWSQAALGAVDRILQTPKPAPQAPPPPAQVAPTSKDRLIPRHTDTSEALPGDRALNNPNDPLGPTGFEIRRA